MIAQDSQDRFHDFMTLNGLLTPNCSSLPSRSTLCENLNAISNETRELLLRTFVQQQPVARLDDMKVVRLDSTHLHSGSAWPNDSTVICKLLLSAFERS